MPTGSDEEVGRFFSADDTSALFVNDNDGLRLHLGRVGGRWRLRDWNLHSHRIFDQFADSVRGSRAADWKDLSLEPPQYAPKHCMVCVEAAAHIGLIEIRLAANEPSRNFFRWRRGGCEIVAHPCDRINPPVNNSAYAQIVRALHQHHPLDVELLRDLLRLIDRAGKPIEKDALVLVLAASKVVNDKLQNKSIGKPAVAGLKSPSKIGASSNFIADKVPARQVDVLVVAV